MGADLPKRSQRSKSTPEQNAVRDVYIALRSFFLRPYDDEQLYREVGAAWGASTWHLPPEPYLRRFCSASARLRAGVDSRGRPLLQPLHTWTAHVRFPTPTAGCSCPCLPMRLAKGTLLRSGISQPMSHRLTGGQPHVQPACNSMVKHGKWSPATATTFRPTSKTSSLNCAHNQSSKKSWSMVLVTKERKSTMLGPRKAHGLQMLR